MTVTVKMFSPTAHVAAVPLAIGVEPLSISTVPSSAVAVMVLVALVVLTSYSVTPASNAGIRVSEPIVSEARLAFKGLLLPDGTQT